MSALIDLSGQRFERLVAIEHIGNSQTMWRCKCDCGNETNVLSSNLRRGKQKSCGCYNADRILKHGSSTRAIKTAEWRAWQNIKKRCYYENDNDYHRYGGRGIKVCDRWLHSFENFLADMGEKPSSRHSIDRVDGTCDYEPSNCRWATGTEQIINQPMRRDNTSGYKGVSWEKNIGKWYAYIKPGKDHKRISLGYFENIEEAISVRKQAEIKYHGKASA